MTKEKKEHVITFRTTIDQADQLKRKARIAKLSMSAYINRISNNTDIWSIGKEDSGQSRGGTHERPDRYRSREAFHYGGPFSFKTTIRRREYVTYATIRQKKYPALVWIVKNLPDLCTVIGVQPVNNRVNLIAFARNYRKFTEKKRYRSYMDC